MLGAAWYSACENFAGTKRSPAPCTTSTGMSTALIFSIESNFCDRMRLVGSQLKLNSAATSGSDVNDDSTMSPRACGPAARLRAVVRGELRGQVDRDGAAERMAVDERGATASGCCLTSHAQPALASS